MKGVHDEVTHASRVVLQRIPHFFFFFSAVYGPPPFFIGFSRKKLEERLQQQKIKGKRKSKKFRPPSRNFPKVPKGITTKQIYLVESFHSRML